MNYIFIDINQERLDKVREEQKIKGLIPKYDGFCRSLSLEEARERIANGEEYVVRLKLPHNKILSSTTLCGRYSNKYR